MCQAKLAEAGNGLDDARRLGGSAPAARQAEPQISAANRDGFGRRVVRVADLAVAAAVGRVDHVIQTKREPVDPKLRVPLTEAGQHDAFLVGPPIAVTIAQEPNVGCRGDEHASEARQHAVGKRKAVGKDSRMLITTIAIAIFQSSDPARGRRDRVVNHLGDVESTVLVPGDRHRAGDLGLGGHELDRQPGSANLKAASSSRGERGPLCGGFRARADADDDGRRCTANRN